MSFETLLRHEFLISVGTKGADKSQFIEWLSQEPQTKRLETEYTDVTQLRIARAGAHWQDPFQKSDSRQLSFDGIPAPGGLRYKERNKADPTAKPRWVSVLFDYATLSQWRLAIVAKRDSIDTDIESLDQESQAFEAALEKAGGNLFAFCVDTADSVAVVD